jgi:hypothetical protein
MDTDHTITCYCETTGVVIESIYLRSGWNTFSVPVILDESIDTWGEFIDFNDLVSNCSCPTTRLPRPGYPGS